MNKCKGHLRHWFTKRGAVGEYLDKCVRCGAPNPRSTRTEIDGTPTAFETKILKKIKASRGSFGSGAGRVHWVAAARRLERMGFASKPGLHWWTTEKGDKYLDSLRERRADI